MAGRPVSILVRNIPTRTSEGELRDVFERYGEVRDVYIPTDYYTRRPKGFAFLEFTDIRDAEDAMSHENGQLMGNREMEVIFAKERRKTPDEMRRIDRRSRDPRGGRDSRRDFRRDYDRDSRRDYDRDSRRDYGREYRPRRRSPSPFRRRRDRSPHEPRRHRSRSRSVSPGRDRPPRRDSREYHKPSQERSRSPMADHHITPGVHPASPRSDSYRNDHRDRSPSVRSASRSPPRVEH